VDSGGGGGASVARCRPSPGCCGASPCARLGAQYFSMKALFNRGPNDLAGGDRHSVELTESHNQSWKPPGPCWTSPGPLSVLRARSLQIVDGIRNQLSHVDTYLCHDGIN